MFGHRHMRSLAMLGNIVLEEAPNLGAEDMSDYGFYGVTVGANSYVRIHWLLAH
jgi:hypothetical protein